MTAVWMMSCSIHLHWSENDFWSKAGFEKIWAQEFVGEADHFVRGTVSAIINQVSILHWVLKVRADIQSFNSARIISTPYSFDIRIQCQISVRNQISVCLHRLTSKTQQITCFPKVENIFEMFDPYGEHPVGGKTALHSQADLWLGESFFQSTVYDCTCISNQTFERKKYRQNIMKNYSSKTSM